MEQTTQPQPANTPVSKVRLGRIQASIWENAGQNGTHYGVTFERRYRDAQGNWQSSQSYNAQELLLLSKAADKAHDEVLRLRAAKASAA